MAHFAKLNQDNLVIDVVVVANDVLLDSNNEEQEQLGIDFLNSTFGEYNWKQTSFNGSFRKNYAGVGYSFNEDLNAFIPEKPFNSWILNKNTCQWDSPKPRPSETLPSVGYMWDESDQEWIEITLNI